MIFSTKDVHPRERVSYWVEVASRGYVEHDFRPDDVNTFDGTLEIATLGGSIALTTFSSTGGNVRRSEQNAARTDTDDILFSMLCSGEIAVSQDGIESSIHGRGMFLVDPLRPFEIALRTPCNSISLRIPRPLVEARLGNLAGRMARPVTASTGVGALAMGFLELLPEQADALDDTASLKAAEQLLDLLALAFSAESGGGASLSSPRATTLLRLKTTIEHLLVEPDLRPERVAAEAGISVRYANALLAEEHTSIERYIAERRLERCRAALEDAAQSHRSIGEIAFKWGFSDLSHFGRRFKARYGLTPTDYRRRAARIAAASPFASAGGAAVGPARNGVPAGETL
jgi:AraC family transcriptional activator of tynA and feaB